MKTHRTYTLLLATLLLCGCARKAEAPSADAAQRPFPDLGGRTVMLLPLQAAVPLLTTKNAAGAPARALGETARAALEAELSYWLADANPRIRWLLPDAIDRAVTASPMLGVRVRELPVQDFLRARLDAIGDPLYGELRKVGALMDTRPALLPIGAVWIPEADGRGRVHVMFALIDTTGGTVLWSGAVAGEAAERAEGAAIASAAQALGRMVAR